MGSLAAGCLWAPDTYYAPPPTCPRTKPVTTTRTGHPSNFCQPMITTDDQFEYENAICTVGCYDVDHRRVRIGVTGENGSCYVDSIVGGPAAQPVACFERCFTDGRLFDGFICVNDLQLAGLLEGDAICVPGF
ncbi:MAG: hypothetical protein R3A47_04525 [Polyangiales bacterium]